MTRLGHDEPPWTGPFITLAELDTESGQPVPARRFIVRSVDGDRTFLACRPRADVDPHRWAIEAEGARRLSIPGFLPVEETGGTAELPWCTTPYVPALPLPAALQAHGGPLPEPAVRALGSALAQSLAAAHAQGVTHAGLSPAAVLITTEGPRLSCFGAVRAAAPDGESRDGLPGLDSGCLAPEQAAGGRPRPLGDVYALGAVLAYASTGHTVPERQELPAFLRTLIPTCLSRDPVRRPQAHEILTHLTPGGSTAAYVSTAAHPHTVLDATVQTPLPAALVAALARQSAQVLAAELPPAADLD
ncbi:serine/threonine protein kinase [Streptomyces sp. P9(2023)]|uniref:serine/threonine protein kinase n=1 Tax=Streptomyces sp. P9(2023) TaxID=3064394 RepID=UPI0028F43F6B|nr:serine/threonine protein kinase [Streptomyces sp. P9(2023)]MDT9693423.1 serine/threonine protein kinase [Streptomyces sp. P9(2023)]